MATTVTPLIPSPFHLPKRARLIVLNLVLILVCVLMFTTSPKLAIVVLVLSPLLLAASTPVLRPLSAAQLAEVIDTLKVRWAACGQPPLYLSFDIDALDPAFAPGTGTPEPGGLTTAQALTLLEELAGENWVGMDCVEVAPPYDHADLSSNAAATLVWTYLCGQAAKKAPE